jgi:hypothetical protein
MFSKISRYRKLPDEVSTDVQGRTLPSKTLRPLPEVSGDFLHTLEEVDRLDHLAYKYYKQPRKWWRLCDANPGFLSPQAMLGVEPIVSDRFALTWDDEAGQPPWAELRQQLLKKVGVVDVYTVGQAQLVPTVRMVEGQQVTVEADHYARAVIITYNRVNVSAETLGDVITATGFETSQAGRIGRVGKQIIIPPDSVR